MVIKTQIDEITASLMSLPEEKIAAVKDYVDFLKTRYDNNIPIDESDEWTEEDIQEFRTHCRAYAETQAPWDDSLPEGPQAGGVPK